jgi:hypothetical protein
MSEMIQAHVTEPCFQLLKETFEGPPAGVPSAFLNKGTGLFQTLEEVVAAIASAQAKPGGSTIAAHVEHVRFYVVVHTKLLRGSTDPIDWNESWRVKTVEQTEWEDLKQELCRSYGALTDYLRRVENWGEDEVGVAMAVVAHTAYHLGAIRQLMLVFR